MSASSNSKDTTSSTSSHHRREAPITSTSLISLVQDALQLAKQETRNGGSTDLNPGVTIDLSHKRIAQIPIEVIELVRDEIERLALAHNQLTGFADEFSSLSRLRYLNLRSNILKEFPPALCNLPALEILDVSRNKLRSLPADFGSLINLKVLSMSKNRLQVLPTYIGDMHDLKILKIDHNPIVFPPKDVLDSAGDGEDFRDMRLEQIKKFLRQHAERAGSMHDTESGSSDEGENDYADLTVKPNTSGALPRPPPIPSRNQHRVTAGRRVDTGLPLPSPSLSQTSSMESSAASNNVLSAAQLIERSRSNSESTIQNARANKRMGNIFPRGEKLGTVDEVKTSKHHHVRGYSHDSIIETQRSTTNESVKEPAAPAQSPTEQEKQHAGHYFRRLSSLPEQKRTSLSSARVAESARGILYALAQSQSAISNFISSSGDRGRSKTLDRVLYSTNNQIGNLVQALENYDAREDETVVEPLLSACAFCIGAFRHVLSLLQSNLKELSSESDIRYTRTLLLMIYGSLNELMNSWAALRPALPPPPSSGFAPQPTSNFARQLGSPLPNMRLKSGSVASTTMTLAAAAVAAAQGIPPPLPTPRSPDPSFIVPSTPVISQTLYMSDLTGSENDETLFENVNHATSAALSTLPQITEAASKLALHQSLPPNTMIKLKELTVLCMSGRDVARRLRVRLDSIREVIRDNDIPERRRFWDDTNSFIKSIIDIAEICKLLKSENAFPSHVASNISAVIRSARALSILNSISSFRQFKETDNQANMSTNQYGGSLAPFQPLNHQFMSAMPSTPLSAALGAAAQATIPHHTNINPFNLSNIASGLNSRTETMLSSRTMTSTTTDIGSGFAASLGGPSGLGPLSPPSKEMKQPPVLRMT